jgi:hypothetical protein
VSIIPLFFSLIFSLFYCYFSCGTASLSIFGNTHRTLKMAPQNIITNSDHHPPLFFSLFYAYFLFGTASLSIFGNTHWTLKIAPQTSSPTVSTIPLFFLFFIPYFIAIFLFGTASLSIFGNAHWTLKTAPPNIITNSEDHPPIFSSDFSAILLLFFI